jgi:hypothetical protein
MKRSMGVAAVAAVLWGCASAPPPAPVYEAATQVNAPGYITAPAENGRYLVSYTGTRGMTREQVAQFALLRAAEFTAESGKEWFAVINTKTQSVIPAAQKDDLKNRSGGGFIGGPGGSSTGAGGSGSPATTGTVDATTGGSATAGGFGGGAPPTQVLERWTPPKVLQTAIVIQMGSGEKAEFAGLTKAPEIFPAKSTADDIRAKMKP